MTDDSGQNFFTCVKDLIFEHRNVVLAVAAIAASFKIRNTLKWRETRRKWDSAGKDIVVLHAGGPSTGVPHASPFALKLDTYLTMAGISFKNDSRKPFGPKGKLPWITLNGEDLADSQLIINHLNEKFEKDLNSNLTAEQKAIATSLRIMVEEHLLWGIAWWRFIADSENNFITKNNLPWSLGVIVQLGFVRRRVKKMLWAQGLGRHSDQILINMMTKDIETLSVFLGEKMFMMGSEPCELDCTVFGFLSCILWGLEGNPWIQIIMDNYPNLRGYCYRMKATLYPDWEQRLLNRSKL